MVLYICLGAGGGLILLGILTFFIMRSKAKKRLSKLSKLVKDNKQFMQEVKPVVNEFSGIMFEENQEAKIPKNTDNIDISKFSSPYEEEEEQDLPPNMQAKMRNFMRPMPNEIQEDVDDFENFRREHSHSKYFVDESLAQELKKMSPKMKAVVLGDLLKKIDHKE